VANGVIDFAFSYFGAAPNAKGSLFRYETLLNSRLKYKDK